MNQSAQPGPGVGRVIFFFLLGLILLAAASQACLIPGLRLGWGGLDFQRWPFFPVFGLMSLWGVIQVALAVWVGVDASRRGLSGVLWGLLVLFTGIIGLIVYLLVGPGMASRETAVAAPVVTPAVPGSVRRCPGCEAALAAEFKACPYCGRSVRCKQCERPIEAGWKVCPFCTAALD